MAESTERVRPAYVPYPTFRAFIARLKAHVVPGVIDYSVMGDGMAGGTKGHLRSTLRFLRLIDENGNTQPPLRALVDAYESDQWATALSANVWPAYADILNGLDLTKATPKELNDRFREIGGADGQLLEKAIRFFLAVASEAKRPVSSLIVPAANGSSAPQSRRRRSAPRAKRGDVTPVTDPLEKPDAGQGSAVIHRFQVRRGVYVRVAMPEDLSEAEAKRAAEWLCLLPLPEGK